MRKHFLLLFLMALLPFTAWADPTEVDISQLANAPVITLSSAALPYNGVAQQPTINSIKVGEITYQNGEWQDYFTVKYYKNTSETDEPNWVAQNANQIRNAGNYGLTIIANGATDADNEVTYTEGNESAAKKTFAITKIDLEVNLGNGAKVYGADDPEALAYTLGTIPAGAVTPVLYFDEGGLPRANDNAAGDGPGETVGEHDYAFTLNDNTQEVITALNYKVIIKNQPKLVINKKPIVLTFNEGDDVVKEYGIDFTNTVMTNVKDVAKYAVSDDELLEDNDLVGDDALEDVLSVANAIYAPNYGEGGEAANVTYQGTALENPAEFTFGITIPESAAANYTFTVEPVALKVKQVLLTTATNTYTYSKTETTTSFPYNAATQGLTKKLVYKKNNAVLLDESDENVEAQVAVTYQYKGSLDENFDATEAFKNAGSYKAYIAPASAKGNFYTGTQVVEGVTVPTYAAIAAPAFDFTIAQVPLFIYVEDQTMQYKGADYDLPTGNALEYNGLLQDESDVTNVTTKVDGTGVGEIEAQTTIKNVNTYTIVPVVAANDELRRNYTINPVTGTYEITAKAITITAKPMNVVYGTAIAGEYPATVDGDEVEGNVTVTTDGVAVTEEDLAAILAAYNVVVAAQEYATRVEPYKDAITVEEKELDPEDEEDAAILAVLANFTITPVAGDVTIQTGSYTILAKNKTITYGDALTWNDIKFGTSGLPAQTAPASVKFILVNDADAEDTYTNATSDEAALPKNAGTYTIKIDAINSDLAIENYTTPTVDAGTIIDGKLTINTKAITFKTSSVKVNRLATAADLNTMGQAKVSIVDAEDETKAGLAYPKDKILFTLAFNADAEGDNYDAETAPDNVITVPATGDNAGKLTSPVDNYAEGYIVKAPVYDTEEALAAALVKGGYANANYTITWNVAGELEVVGANVLILNQQADDLMATLAVANGTAYDVTLTGLKFGKDQGVDVVTMNAKKWYSMVLPFEISVAQLSSTLGYAIVNRMDQTTSDGNVHFRLTFDKIPANEPFLVKAVKGVNGDETSAIEINGKTFENVTITDPKKVTVSIETADAISFTGVYEKQHYPAVGAKGYSGKDNFWEIKTANVSYLDPFRSYWIASPSARVFVEDLDENGTTVIKEINAQTLNEIAADGWYTVNGMKLQSIPTEKGVYIHNGKKVVLK